MALRLIKIFDSSAPTELREQILRYQMSAFMTDVERASLFGLPKNCRMREGAKIISPEKLKCGESVYIGENVILDASGGLEIGAHTTIAASALVWSHSSHKVNKTLKNVKSSKLIERKKTVIGEGCFISGPSVILAGIKIGDRAVIGPMSIVDRNIADGEVFATAQRLNDIEKDISELKKKLQ
jgi:acetyltransferase-like isoleucine patch superfamily enzyme